VFVDHTPGLIFVIFFFSENDSFLLMLFFRSMVPLPRVPWAPFFLFVCPSFTSICSFFCRTPLSFPDPGTHALGEKSCVVLLQLFPLCRLAWPTFLTPHPALYCACLQSSKVFILLQPGGSSPETFWRTRAPHPLSMMKCPFGVSASRLFF